MKKSEITQDLVNIYPEWSKIRTDDQSVGYQFLNAFAIHMEDMDKQLEKMRFNQYLTTANLDEIDLTYAVQLPTTFNFTLSNLDPLNPTPITPIVRGLVIDDVMSGYVDVFIADANDVQSLWYTSIPNRANIDSTASGLFELLTQNAEDFPWSGQLDHHLHKGGRIWIEAIGGQQYIQINNRGQLDRGKIIIQGITRKGTFESETFIFPWDQKQPSLKEWKFLTSIDAYNIPEGVSISIRSGDFNHGPYQSFYNLAMSENRNKVDTFWNLNTNGQTLERVGYVTDQWQQLVLGFSDTEIKEEWDLLDSNWTPFSGVDLAIQPFQDRAWIATKDGKLFCYDLFQTMASGLDDLQFRTPGSEVQFEVEKRRIIKNENIVFNPWHTRPLQEIAQFRVWYKDPSGNKYGIKNGSPVSFSSNFWVVGSTSIQRMIANPITISATQHGEYLLVVESLMLDGTTHTDRVIVQVQNKLPLTTIDISSQLSEDILGIDFDSDQKLWVKTATKYYLIDLFTDKMIVDFTNKIIYLKESYSNIEVTP